MAQWRSRSIIEICSVQIRLPLAAIYSSDLLGHFKSADDMLYRLTQIHFELPLQTEQPQVRIPLTRIADIRKFAILLGITNFPSSIAPETNFHGGEV